MPSEKSMQIAREVAPDSLRGGIMYADRLANLRVTIAANLDFLLREAVAEEREACAEIAKHHEICADFCGLSGSRSGCADCIEGQIRARSAQ
jgi:hypothetical protein